MICSAPLVLAFLIQFFGVVPPLVESYATKYDHIDIDAIINNRRMVNYYAACMLSKGPCPPEGLEFKRILPEALQTNCEKCTEKQKTVILRVIKRLRKEYPKVWVQLAAEWDPDGVFYDKFVATYGIRSPTPTTAPPQVIINRFDDDDSQANANTIINNSYTTPKPTVAPTVPSTKPTTVTTERQKTTYFYPNANYPITTTTTTTKPSKQPTYFYPNAINPTITTTTNKPTNFYTTSTPTKPRPTANVGVNFQSTVSLGVNIVDGIVKGLGSLGRGVVETGAQIAKVVLDGVQQVVRPL